MPDGQQIVFGGIEPNQRIRSYVVPVADGMPTAITPEGVVATAVSPDGRLFIVRAADGHQAVFDMNVKQIRDIPGLQADERVVRWDATGRAIYVYREGEMPLRLFRLDVATGVREPSLQITPGDPTGIITAVLLTPDGRSAVYNVGRKTSDLYMVTGLR
jgi:hypothetical protein